MVRKKEQNKQKQQQKKAQTKARLSMFRGSDCLHTSKKQKQKKNNIYYLYIL